MSVLSELEPKEVFRFFEALCAIPHGSGNTGAISAWCAAFAGRVLTLAALWPMLEEVCAMIWELTG